MNFRITTFFFALLLTMLWVFGLMIAHKKASGDLSFVVPTLQSADAKNIDKVVVKRTGKDTADAEFVLEFERWYLHEGKQKVKVLGFRIEDMIKEIKAAKHDETADVSRDAAHYGLNDPKLIVTLSGKYKGEDKEWQFFAGNESAGMVYVKSSDRPDKVFAVPRTSIDHLFFSDPNYLRDKRLFDFVETGVTSIVAKKSAKELELTRGEENRWTFLKPKEYGFAGFQSEPEEKKDPLNKDPFKKQSFTPPVTGGVKGLLSNILAIRVKEDKDFVPLGQPAADFGVEKGKEYLRIEIGSTNEGKKAAEILYVSDKKKSGKEEFHYARLDSDDGIMKIDAKLLEPIMKAIDSPGELRSKDVAAFDKNQVDAVFLKRGATETQFFKLEEKSDEKFHMPGQLEHWQMIQGGEKKKASDSAVDALIDLVLGKRAIVDFHDGTEADLKKKEAEWGLDKPAAEIAIYVSGIDKDKKDEKKDKKDDAKKDEKKEPLPTLKKDAKADVTLAIGKIDKDIVHIRRTLKDGTVTRFTMKKAIAEKAQPEEGVELAYLDTSLPTFSPADVASVRLKRTTDKGTEVIDLVQRGAMGEMLWFIKGKDDAKLANNKATQSLIGTLSRLQVEKWLKKIGDKEDLEKLGLKPVATATITVKKQTESSAASLASLFGGLMGQQSLVAAACGTVARREADTGEVITMEFGKETDVEKDKPGAFATHSGTKLLFLAPTPIVKMILKEDLHDRSSLLYTQVEMVEMFKANAAINPIAQVMFASPYFTGTVHNLDPEKVTKVRLTVRTPYELRAFRFERKEKEKARDDKDKDKDKEKEKVSKWTWVDKSLGLDEFNLDPAKVANLVKDFAKLHTDRWVAFAGGPRGEHKLDPREAAVKLEFDMEDGRTITLLIGASYLNHGHFATSSLWAGPDGKMAAVFFIRSSDVAPIMNGVTYFAKERSAVD